MALNRFQPILIAGLLPLLVFAWFSRSVAGQVDFWLLWLLAMTLVGLPLVFAEVALAHRSGTTPLVGLPMLTREADIGTVWRGFGWLTVALLTVVTGHLLASSAELLQPMAGQVALPALLAVLALIALGLSMAKHIAGWLAFALALVALVMNAAQSGVAAWQMTATSLTEWALAMVLALVSVGVGTGLYWQARANQLLGDADAKEQAQRTAASRYVLPVWSFQLVAGGIVAFLFTPDTNNQIANIAYALAMLAGAAYLIHLLTHQLSLKLRQQGFNFLMLVLVAVASLLLAMLPTVWLNQFLIVLSLVAAIWLALFAGWQMKISHLRKSLNFTSEGLYNLWRVVVRIVVPLAVVLALVGWVMGFVQS